VGLGGAGEEVLDEEIAIGGMCQELAVKQVELLRGKRFRIVPPHGCFGFPVANNKFVGWGAAGMRPGHSGKGARGCNLAFTTLNSLLEKSGDRAIMEKRIGDIGCHLAVIVVDICRRWHCASPSNVLMSLAVGALGNRF
jgi:hypothetical protein